MANYNEIHEFAEKWIDKYRDQKINYIELVDHYFADDCGRLGFEMVVGKPLRFVGAQVKEQFMEAQKRLTLEGNIVYPYGYLTVLVSLRFGKTWMSDWKK